ncbi:hypothetical protein INR49_025910 [Caranx melampygus]|nr:hypothetical protein INR49_025910 [Caranx melampygus]
MQDLISSGAVLKSSSVVHPSGRSLQQHFCYREPAHPPTSSSSAAAQECEMHLNWILHEKE